MTSRLMAGLAWAGIAAGMCVAASQSQQASGTRFSDRLRPSNGWQESVREPLRPPQSGPAKLLHDAREGWADRVLGVGLPLDEMYGKRIGWGRDLGVPVGLSAVPIFHDRVVVVARFTGYDFVLTKSRCALYSEMYLGVERVLESGNADIGPGTRVTAIQIGGTVRLPSGRVLQHASRPRPFTIAPGHRYLLFLQHVTDGDFYSVFKSIEFADGKALPNSHDDVRSAENGTWPFLDQDEATVLREVEGILEEQRGGH